MTNWATGGMQVVSVAVVCMIVQGCGRADFEADVFVTGAVRMETPTPGESWFIERGRSLHVEGQRIFIADAGSARVLEIGLGGDLVRVYGAGPGKGPGEFITPYRIRGGAGGRIRVGDAGSGRITEFDALGEPGETWSALPRGFGSSGTGVLITLGGMDGTLASRLAPGAAKAAPISAIADLRDTGPNRTIRLMTTLSAAAHGEDGMVLFDSSDGTLLLVPSISKSSRADTIALPTWLASYAVARQKTRAAAVGARAGVSVVPLYQATHVRNDHFWINTGSVDIIGVAVPLTRHSRVKAVIGGADFDNDDVRDTVLVDDSTLAVLTTTGVRIHRLTAAAPPEWLWKGR
jgi:hypothetical protein